MPLQGLFCNSFYLSLFFIFNEFVFMKLFVNSKEYQLADNASVAILAEELQLPKSGVAVAVNNQIVKKDEWQSTVLKENDKIIIIKAVCGG